MCCYTQNISNLIHKTSSPNAIEKGKTSIFSRILCVSFYTAVCRFSWLSLCLIAPEISHNHAVNNDKLCVFVFNMLSVERQDNCILVYHVHKIDNSSCVHARSWRNWQVHAAGTFSHSHEHKNETATTKVKYAYEGDYANESRRYINASSTPITTEMQNIWRHLM